MLRIRRMDLSLSFEPDGRLLARSSSAGLGARVPPFAAAVLGFCSVPRTEEAVRQAFGEPGVQLFRGLDDAGLLVRPEEAASTPVFFENFAELDVHRRMLADTHRLEAYGRALSEVASGRVVLDAGTGSGILAALAARAGASRVYGVDQAEIVALGREVMARSGLSDRVTLIRGDMRTADVPEPVDVLVTETFGAFALAEGAMADVAACAERLLAPGGRVLPQAIQLWLAPVHDPAVLQEVMGPFDQPGLDLSPLVEAAWRRGVTMPVEPGALAHPGAMLARVPFPGGGAEVEGALRFTGLAAGELVGLVGWFVLELTDAVHLPTGPADPLTHWQQVFLPMEPVPLQEGATLEVQMTVRHPADDRRALLVETSWSTGAHEGRSAYRLR